jgi:hypothetical protein
MKSCTTFAVATVLAFAQAVGVASAQVSADETLSIAETDGSYRISVPVSHLAMTVPRGAFGISSDPQHDASNGARYFALQDRAHAVMISGWLEPADGYKGIKPMWEGETAAWQQHQLPEPKNVAFLNVGKWEVVSYDMYVPGANSAHLRCEWNADGTWIDLHISVTSKTSIGTARTTAMSALKSIQVVDTPP